MNVIIVGAGASGLMAAAQICQAFSKADKKALVTVLERNPNAGRKLYITGKGRCNIANLCEKTDFLKNVVSGDKFLTGAIYSFTPADTVEYFGNIGLKLKTERGNRAFPVSDKASDVAKSLVLSIEKHGGKIVFNSFVTDILKTESGFTVKTAEKDYSADIVIFAAGGKSYPLTGSDGNAYNILKKLGHSLTEPVPALVPMILKQDVSALEGLSLKNINATVTFDGGQASEFGEMLFTRNGVSGPVILSLSSQINRKTNRVLSIDLKPALNQSVLDKRIISDFGQNQNRDLKNSLNELLPKSLIPFIINYAELDGDKKINVISKEERLRLLNALKNLRFNIKGLADFNEAIITSGGVSLSEINPKTMESKIIGNLYVIGEALDADALTGGFNLQIAWSTAHACSRAITEKAETIC